MNEYLYEFELQKASDVLVRELCKIREGETCVITADTKSDKRVVDATARAVFAAGGEADGDVAGYAAGRGADGGRLSALRRHQGRFAGGGLLD